ncbi:MAG: N-acetylmuramoyl-L-alanine amidase [Nocardioides sp.]
MTDGNERGATARRPLLKLAAGGAALASVGVAARLTLHPGDDPLDTSEGALVLSTREGSDVRTLEVSLGDELLPSRGRRRWESRQLPTSTHSMVGFTWGAGHDAPRVQLRSHTGQQWTPWQRAMPLHDVPDEPGAGSVLGTDLVWIGLADGVQIRVEGNRPPDLRLVLLHPARRAADRILDQQVSARAQAAEAAPALVPQPKLVTRGDWGANESLRDGRPTYNETLRQVHIHHTVNSNTYARADVPALIRGMYAYHTQSLGWSDIGYNFLVDRFGRAYVGRAGGPSRLVRGAHTLGFNAQSTGISVIGNYETARPTNAALDTIAALAAWKLARFDGAPRARVRVRSEGSDRYSAGRVVALPVIDGHRDTNLTACPGQHLYDALPKIRRRAHRIINGAAQARIVVDQAATIIGGAHLGNTLTVRSGRWSPADAAPVFRWFRGERPIKGAREQTYQVRPWDVGQRVTCRLVLRRDGLEAVTQTPTTGLVSADPVMTTTATARRRVVIVKVTVAAPENVGVQPGGRVQVTVGGRTRTATLAAGRGVVRFGGHRRLPRGRYSVTARYDGNEIFTEATATSVVRLD